MREARRQRTSVRSEGNHQSAGYALVLVLLGIALLSLIVVSALLVSTTSVHSTSLDLTRAQLECAADTAINEGILTLVDQRPAMRWPTDGTSRDIMINGLPVEVRIEGDAGKVALNSANQALLVGLLTATGLDHTTADILSDRILDWREPGPLKRLNGAKAEDYRAAGLPYGPRGGPFQSIDELKLVMGMTPDLYKQLESAITVYSVLPDPELQMAPPLVLKASGLDAATLAAIMIERSHGEIAPNGGNLAPNEINRIPGQPGTVFTIVARAQSENVSVTRTETILFTGNAKKPFWILAWH